MYDSGKHTWKNLSVWSLVWWIGVAGGLGSGLAYAASSEAENPAAMDATTMHDPTMEMGEGGEHQGDKESGEESEKERKIKYWTCGMHPSVRAEGPGKCPICAMNLVPVYEQAPEGEVSETSGSTRIKLSPREVRLADVRTDMVRVRSLHKNIRVVGKVTYDERRLAHVAAWVGGRVDRLFVNFTGAEVVKGQPLLQIYSPDLVTTQEEYLLALETLDKVQNSRIPDTMEGARSLVRAARKRLLLWGISEQQVAELDRNREAGTHVTIYAPIGGTVIKKKVREGMYVKEGHTLFDIADLSMVWVYADIYEHDLSWIEAGQKAMVTFGAYPGEIFHGTITFVDPFLNPKTRSVRVRIELSNLDGRFKPEMFADVDVRVPTGEILTVPKTAVLDTGPRKIAYLDRGDGQFVGVEVKIGPVAEGYYSVLSGLSPGDRVVTTANFLIDSQTQLLTGASAMYGGAKEVKEGETPAPAIGHQH